MHACHPINFRLNTLLLLMRGLALAVKVGENWSSIGIVRLDFTEATTLDLQKNMFSLGSS